MIDNFKTNKDFNSLVCQYCDNSLQPYQFYQIYRLIIYTNKNIYKYGINKLTNDLSEYCMHKGYHLSATQIILLRPDILKNFLSSCFSSEEIIFWFLQESEICYHCFSKEYINYCPER